MFDGPAVFARTASPSRVSSQCSPRRTPTLPRPISRPVCCPVRSRWHSPSGTSARVFSSRRERVVQLRAGRGIFAVAPTGSRKWSRRRAGLTVTGEQPVLGTLSGTVAGPTAPPPDAPTPTGTASSRSTDSRDHEFNMFQHGRIAWTPAGRTTADHSQPYGDDNVGNPSEAVTRCGRSASPHASSMTRSSGGCVPPVPLGGTTPGQCPSGAFADGTRSRTARSERQPGCGPIVAA